MKKARNPGLCLKFRQSGNSNPGDRIDYGNSYTCDVDITLMKMSMYSNSLVMSTLTMTKVLYDFYITLKTVGEYGYVY